MGRYLTAEQAKAEYIERMGKPLGQEFHALWQETAWLHAKWAEYVELFGTKESRFELLNAAAPRFFRFVQDSLWDDTILHIARLTDHPNSAGKANLTIQRLPDLVNDAGTKKTVSHLVDIAINNAQFCRDWRNRHIAHRDLDLALHEGAKLLEPASRMSVKQALKSIVDVLNAVTEHYTDSTSHFDFPSPSGGAASLLYVLDDGLRADAERQERVDRREFRKEDIEPRNL
jgi:hypothetical protein